METMLFATALRIQDPTFLERGVHARTAVAAAAASYDGGQRKEEQNGDPVVVSVCSPLFPSHSPYNSDTKRHIKIENNAATARPVVLPLPPEAVAGGEGVSSSSSFLHAGVSDHDESNVASTSLHLIVADHPVATEAARLSSSPVDVPPSAVPASRYQGVYDGVFHLPPGMTKRALGRLRIVWCCVLTPESWHAFFVAGPILFFSILFVTVVVPPKEWFSYLFTFVFAAVSLACLALSVTLDPGVIPPAPLSEQPGGPVTIMVDEKPVQCKVCTTCHIFRPPRSSHCKFCDVCVEEFDHHCGVLGSCVAKRTFRFFGGFFITTTFLAFYVGIRSFVILVTTDFTDGNEDLHLLGIAAGSVVCLLAAIIGGAMVVPFAGRYVVLSAKNETTKETMRREKQEQSGQLPDCVPVEEVRGDGYWKNLTRRLFSPLGRSRIPFDYYV